jgi:hypothetical protein
MPRCRQTAITSFTDELSTKKPSVASICAMRAAKPPAPAAHNRDLSIEPQFRHLPVSL